MVRVYENRCGCAATPDFLQQFTVSHLCKAPSAVFHWRSRTEHAGAPKTVDDAARNLCLSIYLRRIETCIEKLPKFPQRLVQLRLLRCRHARIRHYPIGHETTLEKTLGKTERLRPREKQFFGLLNFLLPLRVQFVHKNFAALEWRHCSEQSRHVQSRAPSDWVRWRAPSNG